MDVVYSSLMRCLCDSVLCRMEELILCETLGVWGYVYAGSVAIYVYLGHTVEGDRFHVGSECTG